MLSNFAKYGALHYHEIAFQMHRPTWKIPVAPVAPVAPVPPCSPVAPGSPVAPVAPGTPANPVITEQNSVHANSII